VSFKIIKEKKKDQVVFVRICEEIFIKMKYRVSHKLIDNSSLFQNPVGSGTAPTFNSTEMIRTFP
jgi:hypothetical protein